MIFHSNGEEDGTKLPQVRSAPKVIYLYLVCSKLPFTYDEELIWFIIKIFSENNYPVII